MSKLRVFIIAGEVSGDYCGSKLIASMKRQHKGQLVFSGVGGDQMEKEGFHSIFPISKISVMGIVEIIPRIFQILRLITFTATKAIAFKPSVVVTIDAPGFSFRVVKKLISLRNKGVKFVHYVSPSVWAYRPERVYEMAKYYDLVLALLPFEPKYYEKSGLRCEYVGHHLVENEWSNADSKRFREKHDIDDGIKIIGVLCGSREPEVVTMLPIFIQVINKFLGGQKNPEKFMVVYPSVSEHISELIDSLSMDSSFDYKIVRPSDYQERIDMMHSFYAALVKSGTSSLELVFAQVPMVVAYRVNWFSAFVARKIFGFQDKKQFVSLANIILDEEVIPEFVQEECKVDTILASFELVEDKNFRTKQISEYKKVIKILSPNWSKPSEKAAEEIIDLCNIC